MAGFSAGWVILLFAPHARSTAATDVAAPIARIDLMCGPRRKIAI
jgi:hypothetical protein